MEVVNLSDVPCFRGFLRTALGGGHTTTCMWVISAAMEGEERPQHWSEAERLECVQLACKGEVAQTESLR